MFNPDEFTELRPNCYGIIQASSDAFRDMRFLIVMLFRPPMQVRITNLTALRIMVIRPHIQTAQTPCLG